MARRSNSGAENSGRSDEPKGYASWKHRTKNDSEAARKRVNKPGSRPLWAVRKDLEYKPNWDPENPEDRNLKWGDPADFEPFSFRVIRQHDGRPQFPYFSRSVQVGGRRKNIISNSRNGELDTETINVPDLLWYLYVTTEDDTRAAQYKAYENFGIEVEVLEHFHIVETKVNGRTYENWRRCAGADPRGKSICKHCTEGNERVFGRKIFWPLFTRQFAALEADLKPHANKCFNCEKGTIQYDGWFCADEECGHVFGYLGEDPDTPQVEFTDEESEDWMSNPQECPSCGNVGLLDPEVQCLVKKGHGSKKRWDTGCDEPLAIDPWDCVITVHCQKRSGNNIISVLSVDYVEDDDLDELTGIRDEDRKLDVMALWGSMSVREQAQNLNLTDEDLPFTIEAADRELKAYLATPPDQEDEDSIPVDDDDDDDDDEEDDDPDPIPY